MCRMRLLGAWWLIGRKILKMTKFVWMCVLGSGAHLKVCGHALLVAPLVPGPGRPFDDEFSTLGCRGRSVARPPVAEGRVRKGLQGKALPGSYQTQLKLLGLRRGNHQAPLRRRNGANSRRGAPFHTTPSRWQARVVSRSSMYSLLRGRLDDPRKIRCDLLGGTCGFNNSTCFSPIRS